MKEQTPEYDTYEARSRVRTIILGIIGLAAVVGILVLLVPNLHFGEENFDDLPDEGLIAAKSANKPDTSEADAAKLLADARRFARNDQTPEAVATLKRIVASFPGSKAGSVAREALDRPNQSPPLPLFLDDGGATVVATAGAKSGRNPASGPTVTAVDTTPGSAGRGASAAEVQLTLPKNVAEPNPLPNTPGAGDESRVVEIRSLPAGFSIREGSGVHPSCWPLQITSDRDGSPMVFIPPGTFRMGRDDGSADEAPAHPVSLAGYYIDLHEVTNRQFDLYVKESGRKPVVEPVSGGKTAELPVVNVSARDALTFCEWAGKRLPTEAQWEKAARTTDGRMFPWGGVEPTWVRPRQSKQIDPIMTYELDQSPYGVFDMAGNAWEWTSDYFDPAYYKQFRETTAVNPAGPAPKTRTQPVVLKGGSKTFHVSWREGLKAETRYPFVGFRGALSLENAEAPAEATPVAAPSSKAAGPTRKGGSRPAARGGVVPF